VIPLARIADILSQKITGEWGDEPHGGRSIKVVRTTNFTNEGRLNLTSVVERAIDDLIVERKQLKYGDTIIEKSGGSPNQPVGRVVFFDLCDGQKYLCNNFTAILRPRDDVFPKYFFYALFYNHLKKATLRYQNKTTGILNLQLERYLQEEIPVPSLPVQEQIAAILDEADAARQKRREANHLTEQFLQSAFLEMFGDPVTNPKRWKEARLGDIAAKFSDGPFGSNLKTEHYTESGVRVIRLQNIGVGDLIDADKAYISEEHFASLTKHTCLPGDVMVGTLGVPNLRACILPQSIPVALNKADCIQMRPLKGVCTSEYACHLLNQPATLILATGMIHGQTRARINMGRLRELVVPCPPLKLQGKFSALVEKVESLRAKQRESEKDLDTLFNSLMQEAFRGELVG
jgi:type I restriction enzyme, S subunit